MVITLHRNIFLLFFIFSIRFVNAQSENNFKKEESKNLVPENNSVFARQSKTSENVNELIKADSILLIEKNSTEQKDKVNYPTNDATQKINSMENIPFDYSQMPKDVQLKIYLNKTTRKNLLDGIAKAFTVEIKSCTNSVSTKTILGFLNKDIRFLNTEFVSPGIVRLNVINSFDSVELKELMLGAGISFNFLNEFYFIKD